MMQTVNTYSPSRSAIVLSICWPGTDSGGSIAVKCSLDHYVTCFTEIHFVGITDSPPDARTILSYPNVRFHHAQCRRDPRWLRFSRSLISSNPAISMLIYGQEIRMLISGVLSFLCSSGSEPPLGIVECITPCIYLPYLTKHFPTVKWIVRSHDVLVDAFSTFAREGNALLRPCWKWELYRIRKLEQMAADIADVYCTITQEDANTTLARFNRNADAILGVSIDTCRFDSVPQGEHHTLLHLGTADVRKSHGLNHFIQEAWPLIFKSHPSARFLLAGRNTERYRDPATHIDAMGFINDDIGFFGHGLVFVNPQLAGTGIKLKSLNALAAGKLLVTTTNGALGLDGRPGIDYIVADSPKEMANAIIDLIADPKRMVEIANNGRKHIRENFSAERFSRSFSQAMTALSRSPHS